MTINVVTSLSDANFYADLRKFLGQFEGDKPANKVIGADHVYLLACPCYDDRWQKVPGSNCLDGMSMP